MITVNVLLISTYELGRQPFGLASPAAWLRAAGATVTLLDLAVQSLDEGAVAAADLVAFYVPMHTATRLAAALVPRIRGAQPARSPVLLWPVCADERGATCADWARTRSWAASSRRGWSRWSSACARTGQARAAGADMSLARQRFLIPDRGGLPALGRYAYLRGRDSERRDGRATPRRPAAASTCAATARSRRSTAAPSASSSPRSCWRTSPSRSRPARSTSPSATPISSTAPAMPCASCEELHQRFPALTYDVTIKVEHLLQHAATCRRCARRAACS